MKKYESANFKARLIISINRTSTFAFAENIVSSVIALKNDLQPYIVGLDYCGDPTKGKFTDFVPLFVRARAAGIKITCHIGEIDNFEDSEAIINFKPDRLGHGCHLTKEQIEKIKGMGIPIESCPSSNVNTLHKSYNELPNIKWMKECGHLFSLCTDDTILFNNDATGERFEIAHAFEYSLEDMNNIEKNATKMIFDENEKTWLQKLIS